MSDLISRETVLELTKIISEDYSRERDSFRYFLEKLPTVEAVPLSVIEKIHDAVDNADCDARLEDENGSYTEEVFTREHVHEIISKVVKEIKNERS